MTQGLGPREFNQLTHAMATLQKANVRVLEPNERKAAGLYSAAARCGRGRMMTKAETVKLIELLVNGDISAQEHESLEEVLKVAKYVL